MGGKCHLRLNTGMRLIVDKHHKGILKRTLKSSLCSEVMLNLLHDLNLQKTYGDLLLGNMLPLGYGKPILKSSELSAADFQSYFPLPGKKQHSG